MTVIGSGEWWTPIVQARFDMEEVIEYMKEEKIRYRPATLEEHIKGHGTHMVVVRDDIVPQEIERISTTQSANPKEQHQFEETSSGALVDTKDKLDLSLVPTEVLYCLAGPLTAGQLKGYARNNWQLGIPFSKSLAKLKRHLVEWENKVDFDKQMQDKYAFDMRHIDAVAFHAINIALMTRRGRADLDDRS